MLLSRFRGGDESAREELLHRYLPVLQRWARGRLPRSARDIADTDDLVQRTLVRAMDRLESFESRREGAFLAYLRSALLNAVRDEMRKIGRRPRRDALPASLADPGPSAVERAIGRERMERYEEALGELLEVQREAVVLRLEMGLSYRDVATALGCPTPDAARMVVNRALVQLGQALDA